MIDRSLHLARKLRGRTAGELAERAAQSLAARLERAGLRDTRLSTEAELTRLCDPSAPIASLDAWYDALTSGKTDVLPRFFAGVDDPRRTAAAIREQDGAAVDALLHRCERMLQDRFDLLAFRDLHFGAPVDWHRDPVRGISPPHVHWSRLDYLDPTVAGDHKVVWELNRHHVLVSLGQAYWYSGDERYAATAARWLSEWIAANPPKTGINWASSLEIAFRGMAWLWTMHLLAPSPHLTRALFNRMIAHLRVSARHLLRYLSTYFSPNTHLTGEALGLFMLGTQLAPLREAARWRERGAAILLEQLPRHVYRDGVYFEHTTYYQRYTADFYIAFLVLAERTGMAVSRGGRATVERLIEFLLSVMRPDGTIPLVGDDDGGKLHFLDGRPGNDIRGLLGTASVLFDRNDFRFASHDACAEAAWLLGPSALPRVTGAGSPPSWTSRGFHDGGYYVMRDSWDASASLMVIDCGPLGTMNCGHAHADALAFDLTVAGCPLLVDPGTYNYTAEPVWRDHFRSTGAHNTVEINRESSSVMAGPFSWRHVASASLDRWHTSPLVDFFRGTHDGYEREPTRASHERSIMYVKDGYWIVCDRIVAQGDVDVAVGLQCAADVQAARASDATGRVLLSRDGVARLHVESVTGRETIPFEVDDGWVSTGYGVRTAAPRLRAKCRASGEIMIMTLLSDARVERTWRVGGQGDTCNVTSGVWRDIAVVAGASGDATATAATTGVETDGDVVWVRRHRETREPAALFVAGATYATVDGEVVLRSEVPATMFALRQHGAWQPTGPATDGCVNTITPLPSPV